ncbi:hypothetical protein [Niastella yeongjuensis]|nr:hypothetical protein [Niastella yeongjuensis]
MDLSIRPVVIPDDVRWLQRWLGVDADCLIPFYESLQVASFIQSVVVWENDRPVLQVDICEALFDDLGTGDGISPGDYSLRLLPAPDADYNAISRALHNCIAYVFTEKKAGRVWMPLHNSNTLLMTWVKTAGFTETIDILPKPGYVLYLLDKPAIS